MASRVSEPDTAAITVLGESLAPIRKRPGMYVGDTGRYGLYHLLYYVLDPLVEAGTKRLSVALHVDGTIEVSARGCSYDVTMLVTAQRAGKMYPSHDMMSVVATLTDPFFIAGTEARGEDDRDSSARTYRSPNRSTEWRRFKPDPAIFTETSYDFDLVTARLKELAALYSGLLVHAKDERQPREIALQYPDGIASWVRELAGLAGDGPKVITGEAAGVKVEIAYSRLPVVQAFPQILSFANGVMTRGGGSHVRGFVDALSDPNDPDRLLHLVAIVSVHAPHERLAFRGPTKDVLAIDGLREGVRDLVRAALG